MLDGQNKGIGCSNPTTESDTGMMHRYSDLVSDSTEFHWRKDRI
jgi:hypothetical protein